MTFTYVGDSKTSPSLDTAFRKSPLYIDLKAQHFRSLIYGP